MINNLFFYLLVLLSLTGCTYEQIAAWNTGIYGFNSVAAVAQRDTMIQQQQEIILQQQSISAQNYKLSQAMNDDRIRSSENENCSNINKSEQNKKHKTNVDNYLNGSKGGYVRCKIGSNHPVYVDYETCQKINGEVLDEVSN